MPRHPLVRILAKPRLHVLGINSGTSIDGLDGALVEISRVGARAQYRVLKTFSRQFPSALLKALRHLAQSDQVAKGELARTDIRLGEFIADSARKWAQSAEQQTALDLIASHGQTIGHFPHDRLRSTIQIGALSVIAQKTRCISIGDFRIADIAAGGMGAPLSGYYHHLLFGLGVPVLNIGGIANLSVSSSDRGKLRIVAFDTGPGNMIIDALTGRFFRRRYDDDGRLARRGTPIAPLVEQALRLPYFRKPPPKTCGREEFGDEMVARYLEIKSKARADLLATSVEITARSIGEAVSRWIASHTRMRTLVITGGGGRNSFLIERLGAHLPNWKMSTAEEWGLPSRYIEPVGFAALGYESLHARAGNLGGATGAHRPAVLGLIALPPPLS